MQVQVHKGLDSQSKTTMDCLAAFLFFAFLGKAHCNPPNIVVLLADDLGFNDISWKNEVIRMESKKDILKC